MDKNPLSTNKGFSRNMQASEKRPANYIKIDGIRNKRPQTSLQHIPTKVVGKAQFKVIEDPVSDYSANLVPDFPPQHIPDGVIHLRASFNINKKISTNNSVSTGSTKRNSLVRYNHNGTRTT